MMHDAAHLDGPLENGVLYKYLFISTCLSVHLLVLIGC